MNVGEKINQLIGTYKQKRKLMPAGGMKVYAGVISVETVIADLEQLKELSTIEYSRKVKLPQFIINTMNGYDSLHDMLAEEYFNNSAEEINSDEIQCWIGENFDTLCRAWLDGYEAEEEPNKEAVKQANETVKTLAHALGHDVVNSPNHYTAGGIETIDYIKAKMTSDQFAGYCTGNILKYISRYPFKNGVEDLEKSKVYLEWLISAEGERL